LISDSNNSFSVSISRYSDTSIPLGMTCKRHLIILILLTFFLSAFAGCQTLVLNGGRTAHPDDWLVDGANPGRDRLIDAQIYPPLTQKWIYNAAAGFGPGSPLIYQDAVVVGTRKGELHAVDLESGRKIGVKNIGESLEGPLLISDGVIYVTNALGKHVLTAYDLVRGERLWFIEGIPIETAPVIIGGQLIAVDVEGNVRSFDISDGSEKWTVSLGAKSSGQTSPIVLEHDRLFLVTNTGKAFMLDGTSGREMWTKDLGIPVYSSPALTGQILLVPTTRGRLFALSSANGATEWVFKASSDFVRISAPATDGRTVYFGTSSGTVYALHASNGTKVWQFDGPDAVTAAPLLTLTHLFFGTMGRMLYGIERDSGEIVWQIKLKGRVKSAMAARDGGLIVLTEPQYVYNFRSEDPDAGTP